MISNFSTTIETEHSWARECNATCGLLSFDIPVDDMWLSCRGSASTVSEYRKRGTRYCTRAADALACAESCFVLLYDYFASIRSAFSITKYRSRSLYESLVGYCEAWSVSSDTKAKATFSGASIYYTRKISGFGNLPPKRTLYPTRYLRKL